MSKPLETLYRNFTPAEVAEGQAWHDVRDFGIEGRGFDDVTTPFDRLPARAEGVVRPDVWTLSQHSAGLCARFVTNAATLAARWSLRFGELAMAHMPATGVSGLDLYVKIDGAWRWQAVARPTGSPDNTVPLIDEISPLPPVQREFMLYFPLYNGLTRLQLGIPQHAAICPAPPYGTDKAKPICCYGTSIVQGGCASRPGMAYPAQLGRMFDRPSINLGFSGNGRGEPEMARLLSEVNPAVYVLDPLPNMFPDQVMERMPVFVRTLREKHPSTPIVLIGMITYQQGDPLPDRAEHVTALNAALRTVYNSLSAEGIHHLHLVPGEMLLGTDGEATVDGTHSTDVGFQRIAQALRPVIAALL